MQRHQVLMSDQASRHQAQMQDLIAEQVRRAGMQPEVWGAGASMQPEVKGQFPIFPAHCVYMDRSLNT